MKGSASDTVFLRSTWSKMPGTFSSAENDTQCGQWPIIRNILFDGGRGGVVKSRSHYIFILFFIYFIHQSYSLHPMTGLQNRHARLTLFFGCHG